jgi:crotonobetainyl-CoA hydratase
VDKVIVEQRGHVLVVTINRPEARNAVDRDVCVGIGDAVEQAEADPNIRALILTGAGDQAFCAGADLKAMARGERILPEGKEHWSFAGFANHFTSKPTIAAVNGTALGGGTELVLAADLVVAVETASFGLPEVKRGLLAAGGGTLLGTRLPLALALEIALTGDYVDASRAATLGLVNRVVPADQLLDASLELASAIAANGPLAVQTTKELTRRAVLDDPKRGWATPEEISRVFNSDDAKEGAVAFLEKRTPSWTGR